MAIPEWVEEIPAEHQPAALALLAGPEEVRVLIERCAAERETDTTSAQPPEWVLRAVRDLRPLSRKFIVRCFGEVGFDFPENDWTRSLGFGDSCNWTPITN